MTVPILYCDLDGTVRHGKDELGHFVNVPQDVVIFDGVEDLLWKYRAEGWRIVGISNQGGVGLGYLSEEDCSAIMDATNRETKYAFDVMLWCEHSPDADCECRKPKTGLITKAALELSVLYGGAHSPNNALFVGDRPEDEQCAKNSGIRFMWAHFWREGKHFEEITGAD